MSMLKVEDLCIKVHDKKTTDTLVYDVDLEMEKGDILGIVGESGSGKTMTALAIAAIAGIVLNIILPGNDYEFGVNPRGDEYRGIHQ